MIDERNFAELFRQTPEMVCILAGPEHVFELVNQAHVRVLGFDATGLTVRQAQPESVEVHGILDEVYRTGVTAQLHEIQVTVGERVRYFDLTYAPRHDAAGNVDGILILGSEVTERVVARRTQQETERQLREANLAAQSANAAKSVFLANMSHEIRTPLGAILGFIELVRNPSTESSRVEGYLSIVERNSRHLLRIVDDILDLSKVEANQMLLEQVEVALPPLLADLSLLVGISARERGVGFQLRAVTPLPQVVVSDPTRIRQVLTNLAGNAVKFTERGEVTVDIAYQDSRLVVRVNDTGVGISEADQIKLFEAFNQGDASVTRRFGGTGLGLALTRSLCELLGGELRLVASEVGQGSTFEATLRVEVPEGVEFVTGDLQARPTPTDGESLSPQMLLGLRVLVVDDAPDNQVLLHVLLAEAGASVDVVGDGQAGLEAASSGNYDVVLMDIQMPQVDGHSAARQLRQRGYEKPLIALTAHAMKEERERAAASGFTGFLPKPFTKARLLETVRGASPPPRPTILIVDDDEDMREMVLEVLEAAGFSCHGAVSAEEALARVEDLGRPLVVLTDLSLPAMSGEQLTAELLRRVDRRQIRVVLASGWDDLGARAQALGAHGSLRKPFETQALLHEIARVTGSA